MVCQILQHSHSFYQTTLQSGQTGGMEYNHLSILFLSRDSSVGIATGWCWTDGIKFPTEAREFSLLHSVQTGSGAHPASYPMGKGAGS
jgi:hypothetical protein